MKTNKKYTIIDALWEMQQIVRLKWKLKLKKLEIKELESMYNKR